MQNKARWTKYDDEWAIISATPLSEGDEVIVWKGRAPTRKYVGEHLDMRKGKYIYDIGVKPRKKYTRQPKESREGQKQCACGAWADENAGICRICGEDFMW